MFDDDDMKIQKNRVEVEWELEGGAHMMAIAFVPQTKRLSDVLNDERRFVPVEGQDGRVTLLGKETIRRATEIKQSVKVYEGSDPYKILGVSESASDQDLRAAYRRLVVQNHPDKVLAAGLGTEFVDLANSKIARITDAYYRVSKHRGYDLDKAS